MAKSPSKPAAASGPKAPAKPPKARTAGQSSGGMDERSRDSANAKSDDLSRDIVAAGEALTTNQGVRVSDDQNSLKAGSARPDAAGRLPLPREDHPLRPRADSRAGRPRPRRRRPRRTSSVYEDLVRLHQSRLPHRPGASETPVFVRFSTVAGSRGSADTAARRARLRHQVLHRRRRLGPGRQQHPGLLHPGRDQVPRPDPRGEARAAQRDPAGRSRRTTPSGTSSR